MNFNRPFLFILLPILFLFLYFVIKKKNRNQFRTKLCLIIRFLVCTFLVLALVGTSIEKKADFTTTIFAIDLSDSVKEEQEDSKKFLMDAKSEITAYDEAGVVCFGEKASIETSPSHDFTFHEFKSYVNEEFTSIEDALKLSSSLIPENQRKRIVLVSDGKENKGDALLEARLLKAQQITVDIYDIGREKEKEVQLTSLNIPPYINKNADYDISLSIDSLTQTTTNIKIYKGNQMIINEQVPVYEGQNKFKFSDHASEGGGILFRAEIEPLEDTILKNNKSFAQCYVEDIASVLIIQNNNSGEEIKKLLDASQIHTVITDAQNAPDRIEKLNVFEAVILANVSVDEMPKEFLNVLESYVKHTGGGLIVTGGENSFALGGYQGTKLEEILPVEMQLKTDSQIPDLGMVMVIDHSGSMSSERYGLTAMEMAKEAASRGVESLKEKDSIGVIAFDDQADWVVEFQKVSNNTASIQEKIGQIQPVGGTSILPALKLATDTLMLQNVKLKHIILLTDGQAERKGYDKVIYDMNQSGITLSTVAIGNGADIQLLETLAQKGKGRYYFTNEFTDLPEIFAKEAMIAGKQYLNNRVFYPEIETISPILTDVDRIARLKGYVGTTAKPRADVVLKSDMDDPILAAWQFGLGRTAVWTSDMDGKWSGEFLSSDQGVKLVQNLVAWSMRSSLDKNILVSAERTNDGGIVHVKVDKTENYKGISIHTLSSDNERMEVDLALEAPGIYGAKLPGAKEGAYILTAVMEKQDGSTETANAGFVLPYSSEYDITKTQNGRLLLKKIADITGGRFLTDPKDVFSKDTLEMKTEYDLSNFFLIVALLLFLIDIILRKFPFVSQKIELCIVSITKNWKHDKMKPAYSVKKEEQEKANPFPPPNKVEKAQNEVSANFKKNTSNALLNQKKKRNHHEK